MGTIPSEFGGFETLAAGATVSSREELDEKRDFKLPHRSSELVEGSPEVSRSELDEREGYEETSARQKRLLNL